MVRQAARRGPIQGNPPFRLVAWHSSRPRSSWSPPSSRLSPCRARCARRTKRPRRPPRRWPGRPEPPRARRRPTVLCVGARPSLVGGLPTPVTPARGVDSVRLESLLLATPRAASLEAALRRIAGLWGDPDARADDAPHAPRPGATPRPAGGPRDVPPRPARHLLPGPAAPRRRRGGGGGGRRAAVARAPRRPRSPLDARGRLPLARPRGLSTTTPRAAERGRATRSRASATRDRTCRTAVSRFQRDARPPARRRRRQPHPDGPLQPGDASRDRASASGDGS